MLKKMNKQIKKLDPLRLLALKNGHTNTSKNRLLSAKNSNSVMVIIYLL